MVVLITAIVLQGQYIFLSELNPEALIIKEYKHSDEFQREVRGAIFQTRDLLEYSEEDVEDILQKKVEYYYYISDGKDRTYSNVENSNKAFFQQYKNAFYGLEKGRWEVGENTILRKEYFYYDIEDKNEAILYIAFSDEFMEEGQTGWESQRGKLVPLAGGLLFSTIFTIILMIYLFIVTGRKPEDSGLYLGPLDTIYSDIWAIALIFIGIGWFEVVIDMISYNYIWGIRSRQIYYMVLTGILTAIAAVAFIFILLSLARKIKAKKLIKHSLIYKIFYGLYDFGRSWFDGRKFEKYPLTKSLFYRQMIFIGISGILAFLTFVLFLSYYAYYSFPWFLLPPLIEAFIVYWYIKGNNKTFVDINKGFNESLEEQMKAERMKINLITNVSHDLKTPLTSIISYVDLLSKEEDLSDSAQDYIKILSDKSNRLKQIVADLFDLAKSTSGNIHLDLETLDMKKLIEQTLGDMEDEIEKSQLQIRTSIPKEPLNVLSDGNKLYRVFQNVLDNALKYSLKGTRIFIDLKEADGRAIATIKNIAGYEMNFNSEDILQRFNRGDESRTTEGSGLGLSIAESFTHISGGSFCVEVDGDLFKVIISYPLV